MIRVEYSFLTSYIYSPYQLQPQDINETDDDYGFAQASIIYQGTSEHEAYQRRQIVIHYGIKYCTPVCMWLRRV
jgi:hypothetical protein